MGILRAHTGAIGCTGRVELENQHLPNTRRVAGELSARSLEKRSKPTEHFTISPSASLDARSVSIDPVAVNVEVIVPSTAASIASLLSSCSVTGDRLVSTIHIYRLPIPSQKNVTLVPSGAVIFSGAKVISGGGSGWR